jgi:hypothetical protein
VFEETRRLRLDFHLRSEKERTAKAERTSTVTGDIPKVTTFLPLRLFPRRLHPFIPLPPFYHHHDAGPAPCYGRCPGPFASRLTTLVIFAPRPFRTHQPPRKTQCISRCLGNSRYPLQHTCRIAVYETSITTKRISFTCSECCCRDG